MKLQEAYSILELSSDATPEEAKKKYREFAKKLHPDHNKEPDAEDKFKKINEAYQVISTGKSTDREDFPRHNPFNPFSSFINFDRQDIQPAENIELFATISFKDSILGCKQDFKFNRKIKCKDCNGHGETIVNNGCDKCGGRGTIASQQSNMIFTQTCTKCFGRSSKLDCKVCNTNGSLDAETSINVSIPGGIQNGNILRINGKGNYVGNFGPLEQYTDAHLHITVIEQSGLKLQGTNVVSNLKITLLEALQGCNKKVNTILGEKEIEIPSRIKNKEEIIIPNIGVNGKGVQKVILDVNYPDNVDKLIEILYSYDKEI